MDGEIYIDGIQFKFGFTALTKVNGYCPYCVCVCVCSGTLWSICSGVINCGVFNHFTWFLWKKNMFSLASVNSVLTRRSVILERVLWKYPWPGVYHFSENVLTGAHHSPEGTQQIYVGQCEVMLSSRLQNYVS